MTISKICIIGVGLIGGSLAKALKKHNYVSEVIGYSRNEENLKIAKKLAVIDTWTMDIKIAITGADIIILATPVASFEALLLSIEPLLESQTLITDVGSVKKSVLDTAKKILKQKASQFIGAHPIAGKEKNGVTASDEHLFINKRVIITPNESNNEHAINTISNLWKITGAKVSHLSAQKHDNILAATSHLPHVLAFTLMNYLSSKEDDIYDYVAGGFQDFSRIASSDSVMWRDICLSNKAQILASIKDYQCSLNKISQLIEKEDKDSIQTIFKKSKHDRDTWLANREPKIYPKT